MKHTPPITRSILAVSLLFGFAPLSLAAMPAPTPNIKHVVLISIDGLHAFDLSRFIKKNPQSTLAQLAKQGVEYRQTFTPAPADSFPGLMALTTGGTPGQTGIYYDVTYDRALSPAGSDCKTLGTTVAFDEKMDKPGINGGNPVINPALLPLDPRRDCAPVYPHQYLKVNTIFNVVRDAGGYTAWTDKHPVYEIVNGPDGHGVDDLYTPEIGEDAEGNLTTGMDKITASITRTEHYDAGKMAAVINEMNGLTHDGTKKAPVPTLTGLNLQAVNVGQKTAGYLTADGQPSAGLAGAIAHCDAQIGLLVATLAKQHLTQSTLIIVAAKHGNGPIAPNSTRRIDKNTLIDVINTAAPDAIAQITVDRGALLWLHHPEDLSKIVTALAHNRKKLGIQTILSGQKLDAHFGVSVHDHRVPDLMIKTAPGVIYVKPGDKKLAEHGGWRNNDRHVALLIANPDLPHQGITVNTPVTTTQVAPTILSLLGINPAALQAVAQSHIKPLPMLSAH
ncbi:MAG: alkaline phosphatase family protein [Halothiobacillaceae bacterium]|nr:alkaline phosphatase family protein [Halothiobacillaceae bacterium]HUN00082.1 alkaline phosphatase family protein [Halothiobacillus sp.]